MSATPLSDKIQEALAALRGLSLTDIWRPPEYDLQIFEFGAQTPFVNAMRQNATHGSFALHVDCPWRLTDGSAILVGSEDYWEEKTDESGTNARDSLVTKFIERYVRVKRTLVVRDVVADSFGDVSLYFAHGIELDIMADLTTSHEFWRLMDHEQSFVVLPGRCYYIPDPKDRSDATVEA